MKRRHALALLGASTLAAPRRARARPDTVVPLTIWPTGDIGLLVTVAVRIGAEPALAVLDTAATTHIVDPLLARTAALRQDGSLEVALAGGRRSVPRLQIPALRLADAGTEVDGDRTAIELDLAPLRAATGADIRVLLGAPWFADRSVTFDLRAGELHLGASGLPAGAAIEIALRLDDALPVLDVALTPTLHGSFLLDTGNAGALVVFAHRAQQWASAGRITQASARELGGSISARYARSARTQVGGWTRTQVPIALELGAAAHRGGPFDRLDGSLGLACFDDARFTVDLSARRLRIERAPTRPDVAGGFGFLPEARDGALTVQTVLPDSPAAHADLQPGDRIALHGRAALRSAPELWRAVRGRDRIDLEVESKGARRSVTLERSSFFPLLA